MPIRGMAMQPSAITKTLVCIDRYENSELKGRLYNAYFPEPFPFEGILDLINRMEWMFDRLGFPQSFFDYRTFHDGGKSPAPAPADPGPPRRCLPEEIFTREKGGVLTLLVQVQFRRNATWQGLVIWAERDLGTRFESTLELFRLIDAALACTSGGDAFTGWRRAE